MFKKGHQNYRVRYNERVDQVQVSISYLLNLDEKDFKRIISDPVWIKYPSYKYLGYGKGDLYKNLYESEEASQLWYGQHIIGTMEHLFYINKDIKQIAAKCGTGLILRIVLKGPVGVTAKVASRRGVKSIDSRVRLAAVRYCSVAEARRLSTDPVVSIRKAVIKRLGIHNCYKYFLNDPKAELKAIAVYAAPIEDIDYESILNESADILKRGNRLSWAVGQMTRNILSKMSKEDLLLYLNLSGNDSGINEILEHKIQISWGDNE